LHTDGEKWKHEVRIDSAAGCFSIIFSSQYIAASTLKRDNTETLYSFLIKSGHDIFGFLVKQHNKLVYNYPLFGTGTTMSNLLSHAFHYNHKPKHQAF
jgi:hypothetical protein